MCRSRTTCRGHREKYLGCECQGQRDKAGWAICWREKKSASPGGTLWQKAANLGCLPPQHAADRSKARSALGGGHFSEVQVPTSQAPIADAVVPGSLYCCWVGKKGVLLGWGCWPSWDLWLRAGRRDPFWTDGSCPTFSHTTPMSSNIFSQHPLCSYHISNV